MPQGGVTQVVAAVTELLVPGQGQVRGLEGPRAGRSVTGQQMPGSAY